MLRADRRFSHTLGFLARHDEHLLHSRCQTPLWISYPLGSSPENKHDASTHAIKSYSVRDQLCGGAPLTQDSEEQVLSSDVVVIEGARLLLRKLQDAKRLLIVWHGWRFNSNTPFFG